MSVDDLSKTWLVDGVEDRVDEGVEVTQDDAEQKKWNVNFSRRRPKSQAVYNVERQPTCGEHQEERTYEYGQFDFLCT